MSSRESCTGYGWSCGVRGITLYTPYTYVYRYIGRNKDERPMDGCYLRRWNRNTLAGRQLLTNDGPNGLCPPPFAPQPTPLPQQTPRESIVNYPWRARLDWPMIKWGNRNCIANMRVSRTCIDITLLGNPVLSRASIINSIGRNIDADWLRRGTGFMRKWNNLKK